VTLNVYVVPTTVAETFSPITVAVPIVNFVDDFAEEDFVPQLPLMAGYQFGLVNFKYACTHNFVFVDDVLSVIVIMDDVQEFKVVPRNL